MNEVTQIEDESGLFGSEPHGGITDITRTDIERMRMEDDYVDAPGSEWTEPKGQRAVVDALEHLLAVDYDIVINHDFCDESYENETNEINKVAQRILPLIRTSTNHKVYGILVDAACEIAETYSSPVTIEEEIADTETIERLVEEVEAQRKGTYHVDAEVYDALNAARGLINQARLRIYKTLGCNHKHAKKAIRLEINCAELSWLFRPAEDGLWHVEVSHEESN